MHRSFLRRAQPCDLLRVAGVVVRRLENERQRRECRMLCDAHERLRRDAAVAQLRVPVLVTAAGIEAVVEVHGVQTLEPNHAVKLREHAVKVAGNVVPRFPVVARVESDSNVLLQLHAVDDGAQLLKAAADLAALAGHGLEQNGRGHAREEDNV